MSSTNQKNVSVVLDKLGLAVKDYENILGAKRADIFSWKNGRTNPSAEQLEKLSLLHSIAEQIIGTKIIFGRLAWTCEFKGKNIISRLEDKDIDVSLVIEHHQYLTAIVEKRNKAVDRYIEDSDVYAEDFFIQSVSDTRSSGSSGNRRRVVN